MERILPLRELIRHTLIDVFSPKNNVAHVRNDPATRDCLIRLLLGKRFGSSRPGGRILFFSLFETTISMSIRSRILIPIQRIMLKTWLMHLLRSVGDLGKGREL
ncbi:hypothetical protein M432DRAFT_611319 [Thermoascus aurantiacus ATCC 26904]